MPSILLPRMMTESSCKLLSDPTRQSLACLLPPALHSHAMMYPLPLLEEFALFPVSLPLFSQVACVLHGSLRLRRSLPGLCSLATWFRSLPLPALPDSRLARFHKVNYSGSWHSMPRPLETRTGPPSVRICSTPKESACSCSSIFRFAASGGSIFESSSSRLMNLVIAWCGYFAAEILDV